MTTPSIALTKIRAALGKAAFAMTDHGRLVAGAAGEYLTEHMLDAAGLPWIKTVQSPGCYSACLQAGQVARPDYLVNVEGTNVLVDAKNLTSRPAAGLALEFMIRVNEHARLANAAAMFNLPVLLVVWDRSDVELTYVWARLADFSVPVGAGAEASLKATFAARDVIRHDLT